MPAFDFGGPMRHHASARWRTWITPASRSTSDQRGPRNSLSRIPVKIAVTIKRTPLRRGVVDQGIEFGQ